MTAVLVHGNPETPAIWGPMCAELSRDDIVLAHLPGFGRPTPPGFDATRRSYLEWLRSEVERLDGPVDLVGHDWGGALVVELAIEHPELLRTWTSDTLGLFDRDYVWHDMAAVWQTDGAGEEAVEAMAAMPADDLAAGYEAMGIPAAVAAEMAGAFDAELGRCVLTLYRSARQPAMAEIGEQLPRATASPGLAIVPTADIFTGGEQLAIRAAGLAGAEVARLDGRGHWWMLEDPVGAARLLEEFWSTTTKDEVE